ncbi:threonine/serine dehydratase [Thalassobaculum sp.]|uniref:threonine ammonia-lyase n=1 Tax=Thalassobaculum sp. TaxID=2022740 RepID=UPI0032ED5FBF
MPATEFPISLNDVRAAARALNGTVVRTPLLENADVNASLGGRLLIKAECAQRTGAFKIRGAYWRILNMTAEERALGAITYSSGNHALGVSQAARILGSTALIVMPDDAPAAKMAAVRSLGAEIATFDRDRENYDDVVERLRQETGRVHVPPSAHPQVLSGAGTVALEIFEQAEALGARIDAVLTPCGGGGLTASTAIVARETSPGTQVYAVEPELFDDTRRSLLAGQRVPNPIGLRTICDAIMTPIPNTVTFPINQALLAGGLTASDADVAAAMRFAFEHYKIVVEPGAAVGIAAVLNGQIDISGRTVATVVTGGNVDLDRFCSLTHQITS